MHFQISVAEKHSISICSLVLPKYKPVYIHRHLSSKHLNIKRIKVFQSSVGVDKSYHIPSPSMWTFFQFFGSIYCWSSLPKFLSTVWNVSMSSIKGYLDVLMKLVQVTPHWKPHAHVWKSYATWLLVFWGSHLNSPF